MMGSIPKPLDPRLGLALTNLLGVVLAVDPEHCSVSAEEGCC